ncbi:CopD family protein [Thiocapsa sp.]|uniref:CopD family protein n=1 Tax=Thiocapsa sp. TaxID=2024551 RepID=UPI002BDDC890|nr:CopD family protein [Thiocapsa sp.]HSO84480.1 CopD family protein [Thiocapsa sp.]
MNLEIVIPIALHQVAGLVWVGGMFFAHFALRPTLKEALDPQPRLRVALGVFERFFPWVWVSIAVLWLSGLWVFLGVSGGTAGLHVHAMMGIALIMTLIFTLIYFLPFRRMQGSVAAADWPKAASAFGWIRGLMAVNLGLGLATVVIAAAGPALIGL